MKRDIDSLCANDFDVIVVGGGIHGAATAWQCSGQGLKVALIEKADFGSVTSANSLKIIHGGFRYLQHFNIKRMRESIISRRIMTQIAPQYVCPLRCAIPTFGFGLNSKYLMSIALLVNDIISLDRNMKIKKKNRISNGKILSLRESKRLFPMVDWTGKNGSSIWYDALALNSERLTFAFVQNAVEQGAIAANYLEVKQLLIEGRKARGVKVCDSITGKSFTVSGKTIVIAGGSNNDRLLGVHQGRKDFQGHWAKAVNIIIRKKLVTDTAIGLTGEPQFFDQDAILKKKGRFFFFVPWRGYTMIGTTYSLHSNNMDVCALRADVEKMIEEINIIFPGAEISHEDVSNAHAGLVPAYPPHNLKENEVQLVKETAVSDLSKKTINSVQGVFAIKSVKYTTAPVVAFDTARLVAKYLGVPCATKFAEVTRKFEDSKTDKWDNSLFLSRYGAKSKLVEKYVDAEGEIICEKTVLYAGEITYFLKEEMAQTLSDIVFRRSEVATAECPSRKTLIKIAERIAMEFNWDTKRIEKEVNDVEQKFLWKNQISRN